MRSVIVAALLLAVAAVRPAHAEVESELVRQGVAAYDNLEFDRAVGTLNRALGESLTRDEKIVTFRTLAFAYAALGRPDDARASFARLLRLDGNAELDRTVAPHVRALFEEARAQVSTGHAEPVGGAAVPTLLPEVSPAHPTEGQPVSISVVHPGGLTRRLRLYHRVRGDVSYSELKAARRGRSLSAHGPGDRRARTGARVLRDRGQRREGRDGARRHAGRTAARRRRAAPQALGCASARAGSGGVVGGGALLVAGGVRHGLGADAGSPRLRRSATSCWSRRAERLPRVRVAVVTSTGRYLAPWSVSQRMNDDTEATPAPKRAAGARHPRRPLRPARRARRGRHGRGLQGVRSRARSADRAQAAARRRATRPPTRMRDRLLREAQALARLSHPNVIAVHDVGTFGGDVFIAMEFVEGKTLRRWLARAGARSRREILDVFLAAGEGLAAAHRAGLVHRDFKPDNVHGRQRRARARARLRAGARRRHAAGGDAPARCRRAAVDCERADGRRARRSADRRAPTRRVPPARAARGSPTPTPAPPSQPAGVAGQPAGHAADPRRRDRGHAALHGARAAPRRSTPTSAPISSASASSLYHALYGSFPFAGDTADELRRQRRCAGSVARAAAGRDACRAGCARCCCAACARRPADRYPSMEALLAALRADPRSARRRLAAAGAAALALVGARRRLARRASPRGARLRRRRPQARRRVGRRAPRRGARRVRRERPALRRGRASPPSSTRFDDYARAWVGDARRRLRGDARARRAVAGAARSAHELPRRSADAAEDARPSSSHRRRQRGRARGAVGAVAARRSTLCADAAALRAPMPPPRDPADAPARRRGPRRSWRAPHALGLAARYDEVLRLARAALHRRRGAAATRPSKPRRSCELGAAARRSRRLRRAAAGAAPRAASPRSPATTTRRPPRAATRARSIAVGDAPGALRRGRSLGRGRRGARRPPAAQGRAPRRALHQALRLLRAREQVRRGARATPRARSSC